MNLKKAINQLESIRSHCEEWAEVNRKDGELDENNIWYQDTLALDTAINELKKKAPRDCNPIRAI